MSKDRKKKQTKATPKIEKKPSIDTQSKGYQITINNPTDYGFTHEEIKNRLMNNFKTLLYFCMADEKGECHHTHIFTCFSSRVRFSTIKKHFPEAHIEAVNGSIRDNIDYIKKSGKWENDTKHGTSIEGTFEEYGTPPPETSGKRSDMKILYHYVLAGFTNAEIIAQNPDFILYLDKMDKLRTTILIEKYKGIRRLDLEVIYCSGKTGTGKTRSVLDEYGDDKVYRVTDYQHPWDSYNCQPIVVFEEFRNSISLPNMLNYCDIYPLELPARYSNKYACYEKVFILSNWPLERQYADAQITQKETWDAFLRRIKKVKIFFEDEVKVYSDVESYLNRNIAPEELGLEDTDGFAFLLDLEDAPFP